MRASSLLGRREKKVKQVQDWCRVNKDYLGEALRVRFMGFRAPLKESIRVSYKESIRVP